MENFRKSNIFLCLCLLWAFLQSCTSTGDVQLKNDDFCLILSYNQKGIPIIKKGFWRHSGVTAFSDEQNSYSYDDWLPADLASAAESQEKIRGDAWKITAREKLIVARASRNIGKLKLTWQIEISHHGTLFNTSLKLTNEGDARLPVSWYPVWLSGWFRSASEECILESWQALSYAPRTSRILNDKPDTLHSNVYSSDNHDRSGSVPFWRINNQVIPLSFGLAWCGGWQAQIYRREDWINIEVRLPAAETQLSLKPGESVEGPKFYVFAGADTNLMQSRAAWFAERTRWAERLYDKPPLSYPLVYNHWYSVRFDLSSRFINDQIVTIKPYQFDFFVIDAGWYQRVGDWTPNRQKFKPGTFEQALQTARNQGVKVGIWTCPWLVEVENDHFPANIEEPHFYREFMNAYALDLAGSDFEQILRNHIADLKRQFGIDWWKYDQELFGDSSKQGKMKNIIALEKALAGVREAFPDLTIENCMSGGRMINEFTDQIAQIHWIRDGNRTGLEHARSNILEALGALQFLTPSKVERWTNRPDEIDSEDVELLKMYCRSAMAGVWGISADMSRISDQQKEVILSEIKNYRRLNSLKSANLYDIIYPEQNSDMAGIIFYAHNRDKVALLFLRWKENGNLTKNIKLDLPEDNTYKITSADNSEAESIAGGGELSHTGLKISMPAGQRSLIYYLEKR